MSDVIERPASPRPPVSSYDPNMESFTEQLHATIRHDLSSIGTVYDITGTLLHTRRHGMIVDDVKAYIDHPRFRIPITMNITWDEEQEKVVYHTATGHQFTPRGNGYGSDLINDREQEIFDKVLSRMDTNPYTTSRFLWQGNVYPTKKEKLTTLIAPGSFSGVLSGGAVIVDPTNIVALASVPLVVGASALWNRRSVKEADALYKQHQESVAAWNKDRNKTLMDMMDTMEERAVFLDTILTLCEHYEVEYSGRLRATHAGVMVKGNNIDYVSLKTEPHYGLQGVLRLPLVSLRGKMRSEEQAREVLFDGTYLYETHAGSKMEGQTAIIAPL